MKKIEFRIKNYKGLEEELIKLEKGHLYLIKGKGNRQKTSRINAFESLLLAKDETPDKITHGKESGEIEIKNWIGPNGQDVRVHRKMSKDKDTYTMTIDGKKVSKVGDLRAMFGYIKFNAIDFVKNSTHQKGRDTQRDIVLDLLNLDDKEKFFDFEEKEAKLVETRKENNKLLDSAKILMDNSVISKEDKELLATEEASKKAIEKLETEVLNNDLTKEKKTNKERFIEDFDKNMEDAKKGLEKEFVEKIEEVRLMVVTKYKKEISELPFVDEEGLEKKRTRIKAGKEVLSTIADLRIKESKHTDYVNDFNRLTTLTELDQKAVEGIRETKNKFMESIELPVENLIIGSREEGLKYKHEGQIYDFNETQLSKTLIYRITIQIMAKVNEQSGVIMIGDAGHFDSEFKGEIANFAKEKDLLILADEVTDDDKVIIEIVEPKGKLTKSNTGKKVKTGKETFPQEENKEKREEEKVEEPKKDNKETQGTLYF